MSEQQDNQADQSVQSFESFPIDRVAGNLRVPGDKSISHRALMLGALAEGVTTVTGFLPGEDCVATMLALRQMGIDIEQPEATSLTIHGRGLHGLEHPVAPLDMGNSGTAMRLFSGLLAGQKFSSVLTGDPSLTRRPMERVAAPLRKMGAIIRTREGCPPLEIEGGQKLTGIDYQMPVASAQVKSAVLLAGLFASGLTRVVEPAVTRDHTERMLAMFGRPTRRTDNIVELGEGGPLVATHVDVPGDLSSAAFFILAACLAKEGELVIEGVGLNPTRDGVIKILQLMGADIIVNSQQTEAGELAGKITARPSRLMGAQIPPELVPLAIDEFPLIFIAAACATGETVVTGAKELRHKESDRIGVMAAGLRALGVTVDEQPDGVVIQGGGLSGGSIDSHGDHRVAMAFSIGGTVAAGPIRIHDTRNVATSFPGFAEAAVTIGLKIDQVEEAGDG